MRLVEEATKLAAYIFRKSGVPHKLPSRFYYCSSRPEMPFNSRQSDEAPALFLRSSPLAFAQAPAGFEEDSRFSLEEPALGFWTRFAAIVSLL